MLGVIVSIWFAAFKPVAAARTVGAPATVSRYLKSTVLAPAGIVTDEIVVVSPTSRKNPPGEVVLKFTTRPPGPALAKFPELSCNWTTSRSERVPATSVCGAVRNASLLAGPAKIVNALLSTGPNGPTLASNVFEPANSMLKSLKTASPLAPVVRAVVPLSVPLPFSVSVTTAPDTSLPNPS